MVIPIAITIANVALSTRVSIYTPQELFLRIIDPNVTTSERSRVYVQVTFTWDDPVEEGQVRELTSQDVRSLHEADLSILIVSDHQHLFHPTTSLATWPSHEQAESLDGVVTPPFFCCVDGVLTTTTEMAVVEDHLETVVCTAFRFRIDFDESCHEPHERAVV